MNYLLGTGFVILFLWTILPIAEAFNFRLPVFIKRFWTKRDELAPGIPRPSTTLAHLLVSEMLRNLDTTPEEEWRNHFTFFWKFPSFEIHQAVNYHSKSTISLRFEKAGVPFNKREQKFLEKGFYQFMKLRKKKIQMESEAKIQQNAVEAISKFMGVN